MAASPCRCVEVAHEGVQLLNECADGGEGCLANDQIDQDGNHADMHHFSDGGHGGHDGSHYTLATVARFCGHNAVPQYRWQWCAQVEATSETCGNVSARAWTETTVDASGVVGGTAVTVA